MAVKENLQVANDIHQKLESVKKYATNYKKVQDLRKEIADGKAKIKEDKNCITVNYDRQVEKNKKMSAVIAFILSAVFIGACAVAVYFMFQDFFAQFTTAYDAFKGKYGNASAKGFDEIQNLFNLFAIISVAGICFSGAWIAILANEKDDDYQGLTNTIFIIALLMKIANLAIGIIAGIKLMSIMHTDEFFMDTLWSFIKYAGIGLGLHVVLFLLFCFIKGESINKILDKNTLEGAKRADERKYKREKDNIFNDILSKNTERENAIGAEFAKMPYADIRSVINDIEAISPIYCDFYEDKKVDGKQEIHIDHEKLDAFSKKLDQCIEMIKSGRADNIKEALNQIHNDDVASERARLEQARNAQIFELNRKLEEYDSDDYY